MSVYDELHDEYARYLETLDPDSGVPSFQTWKDHIRVQPFVERKPKWLIENGRRAVRKRPLSTILTALVTGGVATEILGEKASGVGALLAQLFATLGL